MDSYPSSYRPEGRDSRSVYPPPHSGPGFQYGDELGPRRDEPADYHPRTRHYRDIAENWYEPGTRERDRDRDLDWRERERERERAGSWGDDAGRWDSERDDRGRRGRDRGDRPSDRGRPEPAEDWRRTKSCRFFNSAHGCRNGDKCPFRHSKED